MDRTNKYSYELFGNYRKSHVNYTCIRDNGRKEQFERLYRDCYKPIFRKVRKGANILEIGCNEGTMLGVLFDNGYRNLTGIDLSTDDLDIARKSLPQDIKIEYADAFEYLSNKENVYDVIFSKAVFEHIKKENVIELIKICKRVLKNGGVLVIDVPNMDWLLASHERYMDFTHECGYNINSLGQIMRQYFGNCNLYYANDRSGANGIKGKVAKKILATLISWSIPCISEEAMFSRQIIGVSKKSVEEE